MTGTQGPCYLCESLLTARVRLVGHGVTPSDQVECGTCGQYVISDQAKLELQERPAAAPVLSGWAQIYSRTLDMPYQIDRSTVVSAATV